MREIRPQPGPQEQALASSADILIYGGSAGGGKSYALLLEPIRHHATQGFGGVIFRRTSPQLTGAGSLWEQAQDLYRPLGAKLVQSPSLEATFPSGAKLQFLHLQHASDVYDHQGKQYAFCVAIGTPVLMASGEWRPIENIKIGDLVSTLEGPRRVLKTHRPGFKTVVRVTTPMGSALVSASHKLLTSSGWASPGELMSTRCRVCGNMPEELRLMFSLSDTLGACRCSDPGRVREPLQHILDGTIHQETYAAEEDHKTCCASSGSSRQEPQPPLSWCVPLVLFGHQNQKDLSFQTGKDRSHGGVSDRAYSSAEDSPACCRAGSCSCGGQFRAGEADGQSSSPLQGDVGAQSSCFCADGLEPTLGHSPAAKHTYTHPYTKEQRPLREACHLGHAYMAQEGVEEVLDLTVEGASHYVSWGGIISQNCGFDELTHFEPFQFWYLVSRLRSTCGVRPYMRCTTNPDPDSFVRDLIDWWIGPDGFPIRERSGVLRWFQRQGNTLIWGDTREELLAAHSELGEPLSLTFISASLADNPALTSKDPGYRSRLMALPEVERERLLGGNWDIRPTAGKYIKPEYFSKRWAELPPLVIYTASDYAVTEPASPDADPDYTEHGVFGIDSDDNLYVLDWWSGRTQSDVWIEALLDKWAKWKPQIAFGEGGVIRRSIEPFLSRRMRERKVYTTVEWVNAPRADAGSGIGYADRSKRAKAIKGRAFQARAAMGKVIFPGNAEWADRVIDQCVAFPGSGHDDAFDVMALMCMGIDTAEGASKARPVDNRPRDKWRDAFKPKLVDGWKTA